MTDYTIWTNPLDIRIVGSGSYVASQCANLVNLFDDAEYDHEQEIRSDMEELERDNQLEH